MILNGKTVKSGIVEGEAIVSRLPFSFLGDLDVMTGKVTPAGHDIEGQSIAGKIFVFPAGKGSTVGPNVAYAANQLGNMPKGMICAEIEPVMAMVAIMNDIPMVHNLDENPVEVIQTGDYIKMDAEKGTVEISRKG
ncbi:aconitase X swivel domain-containing protein [Chloroflexota bacterium]